MESGKNMKHGRSKITVVFVSLIAMATTVCGRYEPSDASKQVVHAEGWTENTHGNNFTPNYDVVFPADRVNRIKITIPRPNDWERMQENMNKLYGEQWGGFRGRFFGGKGFDTRENPVWIPATIEFNGRTWTNVGVRYKGNSSLKSGWGSGGLKLPLKLDFDEFEDEDPEIHDQRFYGFKQLSLSNTFHDSTYMHDAITADILAEAGLPAAETAFYEVIMDYGEGPVELGLYVVIEVIDDTVINRFFGSNSGNTYKPTGSVSLAKGTFGQIQDSYVKKNNIEKADWSDIKALYNVLHSEERGANPEAWRASLESIFNVNVFLEWLAISAIIQHWDAYGAMPHNFYLYHDPETKLLTWISWDHNEVLGSGRGWGRMRGSVSLSGREVGDNWPLISYLLADPIYYERYTGYIEKTIKGAFNPDKLVKECQRMAELIGPYAAKESGKATFESAVQELIGRIYERAEAAEAFLGSPRIGP